MVIFQPNLKLLKLFQSLRLEIMINLQIIVIISLLSSFSKLLEKVAGNQIMKYLKKTKERESEPIF